jgi:hypothetical protein
VKKYGAAEGHHWQACDYTGGNLIMISTYESMMKVEVKIDVRTALCDNSRTLAAVQVDLGPS